MFYHRRLFFLIFVFCLIVTEAKCFSVLNNDGVKIYYTRLSGDNVAVTYNTDYASIWDYKYYSGALNIPETISYNGKTYTVTEIGEKAFYDSYLLNMIIIPKTIVRIGKDAFHKWAHMRIIWLPTSCPTLNCGIVKSTYHYVPSENYFNISSTSEMGIIDVVPHLNSMFEVDGVKYVPLNISDRTCEVIDCNRSSDKTVFSISNTVQYKGIDMTIKNIRPYSFALNPSLKVIDINNDFIDSIGKSTFYKSNNLYSISLPSNITKIGDDAFNNCSSIISLNLSDNLTSIGNYAFYGCVNLRTINYPSDVNSIGKYAFYNCEQLTSLVIPKKIKIIDSYTFYGCSKLSDFEIPESVERIGAGAFEGCTSLKTLDIPNNVSVLEIHSFANCTSLSKIRIGEGYKTISIQAFQDCSNLKTVELNCDKIIDWFPNNSSIEEIILGRNVLSISNYSFKKCSSAKRVYCLSDNPPICSNEVFDAFDKWECVISVPKTCVESYRNSEGWKDFIQIIEGPTVMVGDYSREYGNANPLFEYETYGIELHGTPNIICEANIASPIGTYPIILNKGSVTDNYVSFINGRLVVEKAQLTINAGTYTICQGDPIPDFKLTYIGFKNNETNNVLTKQPIVTCDATVGCNPGEYSINVYGAEADNYDISYNNGILIVKEASIDGVADILKNSCFKVYDMHGNLIHSNTKSLECLKKGTYIVCYNDSTSRKIILK